MSKLKKEIILGFAVLLLGVFSWYFLRYIFYVGNLTTACWVSGIVLFIAWGVALALAMLLIDTKKILYGSFIITLIAFGMFFNNEPLYYFIGMIILLIAFWIGTVKIKKEEKVQVSLNFWRVWRRGLPIIITALILLISLVYYFSPSLERAKQAELTIPRKTFDIVVEPLEGLIIERLEGEIASLDVEASKVLSPEEIQELEQKYDIKIEQGNTIKDFIYKLVNFQINNAAGPYKKFIPIGLAIALFLGLRIIGVFYIMLVISFSYLALQILILSRFVKQEIETKEVETVKL